MTFVSCFHAFYPTAILKWAALCNLLSYLESHGFNVGGGGASADQPDNAEGLTGKTERWAGNHGNQGDQYLLIQSNIKKLKKINSC